MTTPTAPIITALQSLQHAVLDSDHRPSAEEIAYRLVDIEAMVVALEVRAAQPPPAVYDTTPPTDPAPASAPVVPPEDAAKPPVNKPTHARPPAATERHITHKRAARKK